MLRNVAYVGKTYSGSRERREGEVLRDPRTKTLIDSTGVRLTRFPLTTAAQ